MKIIIISIICAVVYIIGMFVTKIVITVYDNSVSALDRVDDFDIVFMIIWPIILPMMGVYVLFRKLYKIAENIGNKISMKIRNRRMR
jgi:hypothetical protein